MSQPILKINFLRSFYYVQNQNSRFFWMLFWILKNLSAETQNHLQHIIYGLPQLRTTIYIADLVARDCDWNHRSPGLGTKKGVGRRAIKQSSDFQKTGTFAR